MHSLVPGLLDNVSSQRRSRASPWFHNFGSSHDLGALMRDEARLRAAEKTDRVMEVEMGRVHGEEVGLIRGWSWGLGTAVGKLVSGWGKGRALQRVEPEDRISVSGRSSSEQSWSEKSRSAEKKKEMSKNRISGMGRWACWRLEIVE